MNRFTWSQRIAKCAFLALVTSSCVFAVPSENEDRLTQKVQYRESPLTWGIDLQYSQARYPNWLLAPQMAAPGGNQGLHLGLDWVTPFPWGSLSLGLGVSGGIHTNVQIGTNADGSNSYASLTAVPVDISLSYRLDYFENQALIPFGRVGSSATFVGQTSQTGGAKPGTYVGLGLDWGVGLELSMSVFDRISQNIFDAEFGVNHTYLVIEYLSSGTLLDSTHPNLTREEVRAGIRFEL
jgi:hypothetical protein